MTSVKMALLATAFVWPLATGPTAGQVDLHPEPGYREWLWDEVPVAGSHIVKGVVEDGESGGHFNPDSLFVCLPTPHPGNLRLKITSIDGRYVSEAQYALSGRTPGTYRLSLGEGVDAKARQYLISLPRRNVAVLAALEPPGGSSPSVEVLPVFWKKSRVPMPPLHIQLQSHAAITLIAWPGKTDRNLGACQSLTTTGAPSEAPVAFNHSCKLSGLTSEQYRKARIVRNNLGRYLLDDLAIAVCP